MYKYDLRSCDVIFVKKLKHPTLLNMIIDNLIKLITRSKYFHVAYFVKNNTVFEINYSKKAGYANLDKYIEYDVKRLVFPEGIRKQILIGILETKGNKYDIKDIFKIILSKIGFKFKFDNDNEFICTEELVDAVYRITGIRIVDNLSPEDLYNSKYLINIK